VLTLTGSDFLGGVVDESNAKASVATAMAASTAAAPNAFRAGPRAHLRVEDGTANAPDEASGVLSILVDGRDGEMTGTVLAAIRPPPLVN
jgi:phage-related baseplate assembly protein